MSLQLCSCVIAEARVEAGLGSTPIGAYRLTVGMALVAEDS